jgi:hypothetical protein
MQCNVIHLLALVCGGLQVRVKPQQSKLEVDLVVDTTGENYDTERESHLQITKQVCCFCSHLAQQMELKLCIVRFSWETLQRLAGLAGFLLLYLLMNSRTQSIWSEDKIFSL